MPSATAWPRRVQCIKSDLWPPGGQSDSFHLIAANLPYVPSGAFADMAPDVRDHEPHLALDGGSEGWT
jgi:release factor glutamine methyltransferase